MPRRLALLTVLPLCAGQALAANAIVTLSASAEPAVVPPGSTFTVEVSMSIEDPWHVYGLYAAGGPVPTSVALDESPGFASAGAPSEPEPHMIYDNGFQLVLPMHPGRPVFRLPVTVSPEVPPGQHTLSVEVRYQACNDTTCLRPARETLAVSVTIDPAAPMPEPPVQLGAAVPPPPPSAGALSPEEVRLRAEMQSVMERGLAAFLVSAGLFGFLSLLTPCVFPMIPITVSLFAKRGERGQGRPVVSALVYGASIVGTYTLLGLILAVTWGASGARQIAADPWMNMALGLLFVVLALSLFGLFEIRMPAWMLNWAGRGQQRGGYLGVMFMGLAFTLTSFTCTVAFAGFLLAQAAQGHWLWPGLGMLVFSACFALPFFLLALFPHWISRLPSSGGWLHITKVLMGFLEIAAALKFFSNADLVWDWGILRNGSVLAMWTLIALAMTIYLVNALRERLALGRSGLALASGALTVTLAVGLTGGPLPLWVATYLPEIGHDDLTWHEDLESAYAEARETGRNIFVDFTGYTCTNCRQMEIEAFPHPAVKPLLEEYIRVRLYTDDLQEGDRWAAIQEERFGTSALPFYALITPADEILDVRAGMVRPPEAFAEFLRAGVASAR